MLDHFFNYPLQKAVRVSSCTQSISFPRLVPVQSCLPHSFHSYAFIIWILCRERKNIAKISRNSFSCPPQFCKNIFLREALPNELVCLEQVFRSQIGSFFDVITEKLTMKLSGFCDVVIKDHEVV